LPLKLPGFANRKDWPKFSHEEIRKRSRLLVIDDSEFPLIKAFRKDGYTITKWNDVKDLVQLETDSFDLILLDLEGVGRAHSPDQGFGILRHIRQTNPTQLIIAFSNHEWSLEYQPFFESADAALPKTKTDYYDFKRTVDGLLERRFSLDYYVERVEDELDEYSGGVPKAPQKVRKAILTGKGEGLEDYLRAHIGDKAVIDRVLLITQTAVQVGQLVQWIS
jgi:CheY-like chemotaxis protein